MSNQQETKNTNCPCPNTNCDNNGNCQLCQQKHEVKGNLPYCKREVEVIETAEAAKSVEKSAIKKCLCPNLKCKRHGDCAACSKNHGGKRMYCTAKEGSFRKGLVDTIFLGKYKKRRIGILMITLSVVLFALSFAPIVRVIHTDMSLFCNSGLPAAQVITTAWHSPFNFMTMMFSPNFDLRGWIIFGIFMFILMLALIALNILGFIFIFRKAKREEKKTNARTN